MGDDGNGYQVTYLDNEEESFAYIPRPGRVRIAYPNGDVFVGELDSDRKKQGEAVYTYAPRGGGDAGDEDEEAPVSEYRGTFVDGKRSGMGKMTFPDGSSYTGHWQNGVKHGEGLMKYKNGDTFSGQFRHNKKHGKGVYLFAASGAELNGEWENNQVVFGRFTHSDGTYFEGYFVDNVFMGQGVFSMKSSGLVQEGEFVGKIVPVDGAKDRSKTMWIGDSVLSEEAFTTAKNPRVQFGKAIAEAQVGIRKAFHQAGPEAKSCGVELDQLVELSSRAISSLHLGARPVHPTEVKQAALDLREAHLKRPAVMDMDEFLAWFNDTAYGLIDTKWRFGDLGVNP